MIKKGDIFYFFSIYTMKMWSDTVIKVTKTSAHFEKCPHCQGEYRVLLDVLTSEANIGVVPMSYAKFNRGNDAYNDAIFVRQNKEEVKKAAITQIGKVKYQKKLVADDLTKKHHKAVEEYGTVEIAEREVQEF